MDKNTQHPVAWRHTLDSTEGISSNDPWVVLTDSPDNPFGEPGRDYSDTFPWISEPLYPAPPVPRDVLMAFGEYVRKAICEHALNAGKELNTRGFVREVRELDLAAIADRYASQVQPERPSFDDVIAVQRREVMANPSDAYMVGLYNGMTMMDANYRNSTDFECLTVQKQPEPVNQQMLARCIEQVDACMDVTQVEPEDSAAWLVVKAAAEAAQPVEAPDLATQLRGLSQQHGWNFVWAMARQIEDGTKNCHKCHNGGLTHSSRCVHYDKAKEQAAVAEYRAQQPADAQPVALSLPFFAYDEEVGLERFATDTEAKQFVQDGIDEYRSNLLQGEAWPSEIENLCWGVVLGSTKEIKLGDAGDGSGDYYSDYVLTDCRQPASAQPVAVPDEIDFVPKTAPEAYLQQEYKKLLTTLAIDEHAAFEKWANEFGYPLETVNSERHPNDPHYTNHYTRCHWEAWKARAMLSAAKKPEGGE